MKLSSETLLVVQALDIVRQGGSQADFCRLHGKGKSKVFRLFKRLETQNLIRVDTIGRPIIYKLSAEGLDYLNVFKLSLKSGTFKPYFRYHNLFYKSLIRTLPVKWKYRLKRAGYVISPRRHYKGWQVKTEAATIFVSGKSVWFLVKPMWGTSIGEVLDKALSCVLGLKGEFEEKFGFRLGYPDRVVELRRQELAMLKGICDFFPKGIYIKGDRVVIDSSTGEPETETVHKMFAVDDMYKIHGFMESIAKDEVTLEQLKVVPKAMAELSKALPDIQALADAMKRPKTSTDWERDRL